MTHNDLLSSWAQSLGISSEADRYCTVWRASGFCFYWKIPLQAHYLYKSSQLLLLQPSVFILIQSNTALTLAKTAGGFVGSQISVVLFFPLQLVTPISVPLKINSNHSKQWFICIYSCLPFSTAISGPPESPLQVVPGSVSVTFP